MRVVIFFACLCLLLFKGDSYIHAGTHLNHNRYALIQHTEKKQHVNLASIIANPDLDADEEYFISDDIEDENSNNFSSPKSKLSARSYPIYSYLSCSSILNDLCNSFNAPPAFFWGQVSDKYIFQRVLRL